MKGINNQKCIGPCIEGNQFSIHPVFLHPTIRKEAYCPTLYWLGEDKIKYFSDICKPNADVKIDTKELMLEYAVPNFGIDNKEFLQKYYDLYSFESVSEWLQNDNNLNIYTKLRVLNCAWIEFGDKENALNDQTINFYIYLIKKEWIKDIYSHIYKYITIDKSKILFKKNKDSYKDYKVEKINFFLEKFNNKSTIYNLLESYINKNKSKWKKITNHNLEIKKYYIDYILEKIKITLAKK